MGCGCYAQTRKRQTFPILLLEPETPTTLKRQGDCTEATGSLSSEATESLSSEPTDSLSSEVARLHEDSIVCHDDFSLENLVRVVRALQ